MATTLKQRVDQHDREIQAIRKLILQGMRMITRINEMHRETRQDIAALVKAQRTTEANLKTLITSLGKQTNGRKQSP